MPSLLKKAKEKLMGAISSSSGRLTDVEGNICSQKENNCNYWNVLSGVGDNIIDLYQENQPSPLNSNEIETLEKVFQKKWYDANMTLMHNTSIFQEPDLFNDYNLAEQKVFEKFKSNKEAYKWFRRKVEEPFKLDREPDPTLFKLNEEIYTKDQKVLFAEKEEEEKKKDIWEKMVIKKTRDFDIWEKLKKNSKFKKSEHEGGRKKKSIRRKTKRKTRRKNKRKTKRKRKHKTKHKRKRKRKRKKTKQTKK